MQLETEDVSIIVRVKHESWLKHVQQREQCKQIFEQELNIWKIVWVWTKDTLSDSTCFQKPCLELVIIYNMMFKLKEAPNGQLCHQQD